MKQTIILVASLAALFSHAQNIAPQPMTQCFEITPNTDQGVTPIVQAFECIKTVPMVGAEVNINKTYDQVFQAGNYIQIQPETHISAPNNSSKHFKIATNGNRNLVWFEPATQGVVGLYEKMEFGLQLSLNYQLAIRDFIDSIPTANILNPFDPDRVNIYASIQGPQGGAHTVYGFYFMPQNKDLVNDKWLSDTTSFPWRFRYAPTQLGTHKVTVKAVIDGVVNNYQTFYFNVSPSNHKGYLKVANFGDERDRFLRYSSDNSAYFGIAQNVAHSNYTKELEPSDNVRHIGYLNQLGSAGVNLTRIELGPHNGLPNYYSYNNYVPAMEEMSAMDGVFNTCENNGMYLGLFRHHIEIIDEPQNYWAELGYPYNPFIADLGLNALTYFTDAEAIKWHKACQRYILARWGYSMNLLYYGYSEVESWTSELNKFFTNNDDLETAWNFSMPTFEGWVDLLENEKYQNEYYRRILNCHSYATEPKQEVKQQNNNLLTNHCDIIAIHKYTNTKLGNHEKLEHLNEKLKKINKPFSKPYFLEEIGFTFLEKTEINGQVYTSDGVDLYCADPTGTDFQNNIWATSFMGGFACGMHWWWDRGIVDLDYYQKYENLALYMNSIDLDQKFEVEAWKDKVSKRKYKSENFYLKSEDKEVVYGWVNNATYFWRNYYDFFPNIASLVDYGYTPTPMCIYQDGWPVDGDPYVNGFSNPDLEDHYGQPVPINTLKIKGLKKSSAVPFAQKHTYLLEFFRTDATDFTPNSPFYEAFLVQTNVFGTIDLNSSQIPQLGWNINANYYMFKDRAYKLSYVGKQNAALEPIQLADSTLANTPSLNLMDKEDKNKPLNDSLTQGVEVYPNPVYQTLNLQSSEKIKNLLLTDTYGKVMATFAPNTEYFELNMAHFQSGYYFISVTFENGKQETHKILKL